MYNTVSFIPDVACSTPFFNLAMDSAVADVLSLIQLYLTIDPYHLMYYDMFVSISPSYLKVQAAEGESLEADYVNALLDYVSH